MLPAPTSATYNNQVVYGHQQQFSGQFEQPRQSLFHPPAPEQQPHPVASTSTFPPSSYAQQAQYYQQQHPWQHQPQQSLPHFEDISPAFKGKAFIYDCMVRALESLSPDGASVKDIFDHVWLNNRAFILARSRDGDTEASRRASTKNTIVNYLSTSPAFDSIGRNRWILTGKRHGADKRGGKIARSTKRKPHQTSYDEIGYGSAATSAPAPSSNSSSSSAGNSSGSSSSSPEISNHPTRHGPANDHPPSLSGNAHSHLLATASFGANHIVTSRSATTPLPLSTGLIQSSTQASSSSTHDVQTSQHRHIMQPQQQQKEGPLVTPLPSHAAPLTHITGGSTTTNTGAPVFAAGDLPRRETFSYGQSIQRGTPTNANANTPALTVRRSFDTVPQILPPRPPRTWHPDAFEPISTPQPTLPPVPKPTSSSLNMFTVPTEQLYHIPTNFSYYETPSTSSSSYVTQPPPPSMNAPTTTAYCPPSTLDELFAQVEAGRQQPTQPQPQSQPQQSTGCAGNSIPVLQQQHFHDHEGFAAPPGFV